MHLSNMLKLLQPARPTSRNAYFHRFRSWSYFSHHGLQSSVSSNQVVLTIKAENPKRLWERRTPLVPEHVEKLLSKFGKSLTVKVETSPKRIYDDDAYVKVGAELVPPGAEHGDIILAVKEIAIDHLQDRKGAPRTYCFFSHTHKGQSYNIPLLNRMVESGDHFIDWELLVNPSTGIRQVSFGKWAGVVGAGELLSGYGLFALKQGYSTPFLNLARPFTYDSNEAFFKALDCLRKSIESEGYRGSILSLIVTGSTGRVGKGAVEVFDQVGVEWARDLKDLQSRIISSQQLSKHYKIIGYRPQLADYMVHRPELDKQTFNRPIYDRYPDQFRSEFLHKIAPCATLLVNGAYWAPGFPRLLSNEDFSHLLKQPHHRLQGVIDISCDFQGGLEFVNRASTIEAPYLYFKHSLAESGAIETDWADPQAALQLISIEILPSELPKDASKCFSSAIFPYVTALIQTKLSLEFETSTKEIGCLENAMICKDNQLMPQHNGLGRLLAKPANSLTNGIHDKNLSIKHKIDVQTSQNVVIFGSGLTAKPVIETLLNDSSVKVIIGTKVIEEAHQLRQKICQDDLTKFARIEIFNVDAENDEIMVEDLVKQAKVVISLLPAKMHPIVASPCLNHSVHLITASYVSTAMAEFDKAAKSKNLIFLNELGLDPGIDHMTAVKLIQELKNTYPNPNIKSFISFCGGLPERSDGLLGYRFSWSPKGVLEAMGNSARFRLDGKEYKINGEDLMNQTFRGIGAAIFDGKFKEGSIALEGLANRDSLGYINQYGLQDEGLETMLRGTLRFTGFCEVMEVLRKIGLVQKEGKINWRKGEVPKRWEDVIEKMGGHVEEGRVRNILQKLGLLPTLEPVHLPKLPSATELQNILPIDLLCKLLSHQLQYGPGEKDLVLLSHEIRLESSSGEQKIFKMELVELGDQNNSAMAKTVGNPIGIGALVVLKQSNKMPRGVIRPVESSVWEAVLSRLESECRINIVEKHYTQSEIDRRLSGGLESILKSAVTHWE
ncbi:hypothetical protein O181_047750 [Austropuccinia psidii MF-1]|uniref:Alanine dehydrogenase/pyridine nucleotide transhydrogenase N-terminal domain-containing protein n=1 Tax=Austropuccinia psidii MF-1 TaxID=1389203 RepID=A0A9Q3DQS3_9BASI|nr:hypothetical protein [Austropuccinia psidii MF-1]